MRRAGSAGSASGQWRANTGCPLILGGQVAARAKRACEGAFRKVLDRVPKRKPLPGGEL